MKVLWFSGGLDSTLLLAMLREKGEKFDIVQIRDFLTKEQLRRSDELIEKWDLTVFSYPAANVGFVGDGENIATVFEMAVGSTRIPLIRDVIDGTRCIADLNKTMPMMPINWTHHIIGSRKDDRHWIFENEVIPDKTWTQGEVTFEAPLYDWTRQQVKEGLRARGLDDTEASDETDSGNISLCTKCLHGVDTFCPVENRMISPISWNPTNNLREFRNLRSNYNG